MAGEPRGLTEVIQAAKQVTQQVRYPILTFEQGADALGGQDASIAYRGKSLKVSEIRDLLPDAYFPIESEQDLVMKVAELEMRHPERMSDFETEERGEEREAPDEEPPPMYEEDKPNNNRVVRFNQEKG